MKRPSIPLWQPAITGVFTEACYWYRSWEHLITSIYTSQLFNNPFNIIVPSTVTFSYWLFFCQVFRKKFVGIFYFSLYVSCPLLDVFTVLFFFNDIINRFHLLLLNYVFSTTLFSQHRKTQTRNELWIGRDVEEELLLSGICLTETDKQHYLRAESSVVEIRSGNIQNTSSSLSDRPTLVLGWACRRDNLGDLEKEHVPWPCPNSIPASSSP